MRPSLFPLLIGVFVLATGCANKQLAHLDQYDQIAYDKAEQFAGDSERALLEAEAKYEAADLAEMSFYAPLHMEQAAAILNQARSDELKGLQDESLIASSKVLALLQLAEKNKTKVVVILRPLLQQKLVLEQLNCPQVLPSEFEQQLEAMQQLIRKIEQGEVVSDQKIQPLLIDLQQLELDTLLALHWQPAKETLDKAEDEGADDFAPKSFNTAEQLVDQAELDIRNNINDRELISAIGLKALRSAQHALYIARDAELLIKLDHKRAENAVLEMEELLTKIGRALNAKDVRHMALLDQANAIAQVAETQASRIKAPLQTRIKELEKKLMLATQAMPETDDDDESE